MSYQHHSSYNIVDRLARRAHSLGGHQQLHACIENWILNVGPIVLPSECKLLLCLKFAKCISDVIYGVSVTLNTATTLQL